MRIRTIKDMKGGLYEVRFLFEESSDEEIFSQGGDREELPSF
jgi:hypothetical protein